MREQNVGTRISETYKFFRVWVIAAEITDILEGWEGSPGRFPIPLFNILTPSLLRYRLLTYSSHPPPGKSTFQEGGVGVAIRGGTGIHVPLFIVIDRSIESFPGPDTVSIIFIRETRCS